ncbi:uncharacterized protein LOC115750897 [Rhodamnia argentea]|uniref:Uncharacterized protein LOC115750897 n=1 Tax=Rhodamnia argentea TaxID=178133 RepID=A0A8B8QB55_9MYRT|nr:uncharacterized protein LOC115750897 [Rhodamnia argentea]
MSLDIPRDAIKRLQIALREEAKIPSYDPDDPSIPPLRSYEESISEFDPCPPYLRCKHCRGRLLRGVSSAFCVFCGKEQFGDVPPDPVNFRSTRGYRWLLDSLQLDGSETVEPFSEGLESNRGRSTLKDSFPLSDLLNLEIRWSSKPEKPGTIMTNDSSLAKASLNLAGLDLDNFFGEAKRKNTANESEEQLGASKQSENAESIDFHSPEYLSLFESVQSSTEPVRSAEHGNYNTMSSWEPEFQSADSEVFAKDSRSLDPFPSSTVDLSTHMDTVFGSGIESRSTDAKDVAPSSSKMDDWFEDDPRSYSLFGSTGPNEGFKTNDTSKVTDTAKSSSTTFDWVQDNQWPSGGNIARHVERVDENEDSHDPWNDFTSSANPADSNTWEPNNDFVMHSEQSSDMNMFKSGNNSEDMDFGNLLQPDPFFGSLGIANVSVDENLKSGASGLDSEAKREITPAESEGQSGANKQSRNADGNAFQVLDDMSFLENVQPSARTVQSSECENDNSMTAWDAEFQSAGSDNKLRLSDPFAGSVVDFSGDVDAVFGPGKRYAGTDAKDGPPSSSKIDDFFQDSMSNSGFGSDSRSQGSKTSDKIEDTKFMGSQKISSMNVDWVQDNQWLTGGSISHHSESAEENVGSLDVWDDFANSTSPAHNNLWKANNDLAVPLQQASEIKLFSSESDSQQMDSRNALKPDVFSGLFSNSNDSINENMHSNFSALEKNRMHDLDSTYRSEEGGAKGEDMKVNARKSDDAKMIMSQMHDLSFMLDSKLSIPPRLERSNSSQDRD